MEAAAFGVANTALNSVVQTTITTIKNEIGLLLGVQEELFFIKEELEMMQGFMQEASTKEEKSIVVTIWVKQVQELAFDVEDCLREASIHLMKKSCLPIMCSVKKRDEIAKKIRMLKTRIEDVSQRNLRYRLISKGQKGKKGNAGHTYDESASSRSIANVHALLVGLDKPKKNLVDLIKKDRELEDESWEGKVISVVGMGGIGKTTLVREVYDCQELRNKFKNHFAWVTVQHPFNKDEFIGSLAKQILKNFQEVGDEGGKMEGKKKKSEELSKKKKKSLEERVKEYLKDKKYLIVLDDLSSVPEWDMIKVVLSPIIGSRIIVTTRFRSSLAERISHPSENIHDIKELSEKDALDLFFKAVYKTANYPGSTEATEGDISTETTEENSEVRDQCMTENMKTQAGLIVERCGGLPLAIVTIGSYMSTKPKTSAEWKDMYEHLNSELANNRDLGVVMNTVLTSSYDGMPYHLKPSLLYLSVFHNHKEIRRSRIIRRWMADGYVMEGSIKKAEEMKKGHFDELMGRSLIQPSQMSTIVNRNVKRCNIHDIMYELILRKAVDESMVSVLEDGELLSMTDKVRHLVITGGPCTGDKVLENVELSHMRSLSIYGEVGDYLTYSRMKLVRVLDLEDTINLKDRDLRSIGKLRHLKYLGLRGTKIRKLPNSLGKLTELETLDIRNTGVLQLPRGLTKLHKLSYLRAGSVKETPAFEISFSDFGGILCLFCCVFPFFPCLWLLAKEENKAKERFSGGVRVPRGIGKLRSLNIFGVIDIGGSKSLAKQLQNLTNLRKLAVAGFTKENGKILGKVIDGLKHLRSLVLKAADESGLGCCLDSVDSPPKYLRSLKLHGPLGELPKWISSLENLEKIHMRETHLREEIKAIEKLPNLKILHLFTCTFIGYPELRFGEGTFPMLQVFNLDDDVKLVSIEKTAFKRLEQLKIRHFIPVKKGLESGLVEHLKENESGLEFLQLLKKDFREMEVLGLEFLQHLKEMEVFGYYDSQTYGVFVRNIEDQLEKLPKKIILRVRMAKNPRLARHSDGPGKAGPKDRPGKITAFRSSVSLFSLSPLSFLPFAASLRQITKATTITTGSLPLAPPDHCYSVGTCSSSSPPAADPHLRS